MYVPFGLAQEKVQLVKNCKQHITNGMHHNATSSKMSVGMNELFALREDSIN
jgi:hypothetical protein